jgi:phosphoribosylformylglycinamidine synthase
MDMSMKFLHYGLPTLLQKSEWKRVTYKEPVLPQGKDLTEIFLQMVSRLNVSSFEWISSQYDHEVQGTNVLKPLQGRGRVNGDATVIRPVLSSNKGVVLSQALYPNYSDIDTYAMAASCIDTAIRNLVVAGADPNKIALVDNFCWCSSKEPFRLGQLKRAVKACYDYATWYKTPFISGKDSMFNDFSGFNAQDEPVKISIPPTLLISSIGSMEDIEKTVSLDAKCPGDLVYILGKTGNEMGASEYFVALSENEKNNAIGNSVPHVDAGKNRSLYLALSRAIDFGFIASAQSVNRGGLGIALVKTALGGMLGIDVSLEKIPGIVDRDDFALFSESQGRVVVTIHPEQKKKFESLFSHIPFRNIGIVTDSMRFEICGLGGKKVIDTSLNDLEKMYRKRSMKEQI